MAREQWPDEVRAAREAKVVRYRWLVAEVYAARAAYREAAHAVRVRISFEDAADADAANEVYERLQEAYECTPANVYGRRHGGRAFCFEAIVPKR